MAARATARNLRFDSKPGRVYDLPSALNSCPPARARCLPRGRATSCDAGLFPPYHGNGFRAALFVCWLVRLPSLIAWQLAVRSCEVICTTTGALCVVDSPRTRLERALTESGAGNFLPKMDDPADGKCLSLKFEGLDARPLRPNVHTSLAQSN